MDKGDPQSQSKSKTKASLLKGQTPPSSPKKAADEVNPSPYYYGICVATCPAQGEFVNGMKVKYDTTDVFHRCVPSNLTAVGADVAEEYATILGKATTTFKLLSRYIEDIRKTWKPVVGISCGVGFAGSVMWLGVLRQYPGTAVWGSLFVTVVALVLATVVSALEAHYIQSDAFTAAVDDSFALQLGNDNEKSFRVVTVVLGFVTLVLVLVLAFMFSRIRLSVGIIHEASRSIAYMPTLYGIPVVQTIKLLILFVYFVVSCLYIASCGNISLADLRGAFSRHDGKAHVQAIQAAVPALATEYGNGTTQGSNWMKACFAYNLFGIFWTQQLIEAVTVCTIAGAIARFYWCDSTDQLGFAVVYERYIFETFRYHFGSLVFGSAVVAVVQFFRVALEYVDHQTKYTQKYSVVKVVTCCCRTCLWCLHTFIKFVSRNGYIVIAMKGSSFCVAVVDSFHLVTANLLRIGTLSIVAAFVMVMGKVLISVGCTMLVFWYMTAQTVDVSSPFPPLVVTLILSYSVASLFFSVFEIAIDTILLSICEDEKINRSTAQYYASKHIRAYLDHTAEHAFDHHKHIEAAKRTDVMVATSSDMSNNNDDGAPAALSTATSPSVKIEGYLFIRIFKRRRRYCVLTGRTLCIFGSKDEAAAVDKAQAARASCCVVGVKDLSDLDKGTKETLVGTASFQNALIVSTLKSKLIVVEADTKTEKDRWLHAMMSLNYCTDDAERDVVRDSLNQPDFDAQRAVTLLYKYRDNAVAMDLIVGHLSQYAQSNIDDVEFYLQQIVHLLVHSCDAVRNKDKLVDAVLSICKAKTYTAHLGNSIHVALHLFWLLEAMLHDCHGTATYNIVAMLIMSIEAQVVNQHFELRDLVRLFHDVPGLKQSILRPVADAKHDETRAAQPTPLPSSSKGAVSHDTITTVATLSEAEKTTLLAWIEAERLKRYKYFHQERDFIVALAGISETMRHMEPRESRKAALPGLLARLIIPDMAYIPLGRASDPYCRVLRVLEAEGTVFSTHSRAPVLICFEVVQEASPPRAATGSTSQAATYDQDTLECIQATYAALFFRSASCDLTTDDNPPPEDAVSLASIKDIVGQNIQATIMRRTSKTAYDMSLAKLMEPTVFGESWAAKKKRLQAASPYGHLRGWNVVSLVCRSLFVLQLIAQIQGIFRDAHLPLWLRAYRIVSTGHSTGLIETITDAQSLDAIKKSKPSTSLKDHFDQTYPAPAARDLATLNFMHSLVGYSLVCYILQVKDRHNGNILLDSEGHVIHIDFGFVLGIAPGGGWSLESQPPFKLTKDMVDVLGGVASPLFAQFVELFTHGFLALQNRDVVKDLQKLRDRFVETLPMDDTVEHAVKLVKLSYKNKWTKRYDQFQKITNGILP
ncbi:hypothetical protein DYB26_001162 [Aphanomyces astaci]|uniref:PI3K/PI4K catalytic domain-containing protein n=3 Tax=Aphanomyces astaci TaxID=112090 RepID=A0A3R7BG80_APHAT|nr:hypothetical protein DYB26_001162 [Aphanomyces astaci]